MKVLETNRSGDTRLIADRSELCVLANSTANALELDTAHGFLAMTGFSEDEVDLLGRKLSALLLSFNGLDDLAHTVEQNAKLIKRGLLLSSRDVKIVTVSLYFCDEYIEEWEYQTLMGASKELGKKLIVQFRNTMDGW